MLLVLKSDLVLPEQEQIFKHVAPSLKHTVCCRRNSLWQYCGNAHQAFCSADSEISCRIIFYLSPAYHFAAF